MKKIGFVIPWFGMDIPGGAEAELRGLVLHLHDAGQELEVLTTCVREFLGDWNENYHSPGLTIEKGIPVRRFRIRKRNVKRFDEVNYKLMTNQMPLTPEEERIFEEEMVNSPDLYQYLREHKDEYSAFVFIPYMFGTTYYGIQAAPEKTVMIPCLHDESYIYMDIFQKPFSQVAGMVFNAEPESRLAYRQYDLSNVKTEVIGVGVDTDLTSNAARFREKYHIDEPFLLYAGRKDSGKNVDTLVTYFREYKERKRSDLKLVLIGGGDIDLPEELVKGNQIIDLGFLPIQDKYDAYAAAELLCQPSKNESFSLVIMESWLCRRPVLVHEECKVTKHFAQSSNGGLYFRNYFEFEGAVDYIVEHPKEAAIMGEQGRRFVLDHFAWDVIVDKYMKFFRELCGEE